MMNNYYIFDTLHEANACNDNCTKAYLSTITNAEYKNTTVWAEVKQRETDGKYVVQACPYLGTFGYTVEQQQSDWFSPEPGTLTQEQIDEPQTN